MFVNHLYVYRRNRTILRPIGSGCGIGIGIGSGSGSSSSLFTVEKLDI